MKKKTTRLSRWKAAMCLAVVASASASVAHAQYAGPVVSPTSLDFGTVAVGTVSPVQTLTVSLAYGGTAAAAQPQPKGFNFSVDSLVLPAGYLRSGGTCPIGTGTNSPCTIGIAFAPGSAGVAAGDVAITATSNGFQGVTNVPTTGTGVGSQTIPVLGNLGLLLMLAGLGGVGLAFARRH
jgi:hypothetical protein